MRLEEIDDMINRGWKRTHVYDGMTMKFDFYTKFKLRSHRTNTGIMIIAFTYVLRIET